MKPNEGIPTLLTWMLVIIAGISVANLYYSQPLLNMIREDLHITEFQVNLVPVVTQIGYALGLLLIIPLGDLYSRRTTVMASLCALFFALLGVYFSPNIGLLLVASFITGFSSVTPQIFIPFTSLYSKPEMKERKVGMVLTGLLVGILLSRVVSGYVGYLLGWRPIYIIAAVFIGFSALAVFKLFPNVEPTYKGSFFSLMTSFKKLIINHPNALLYSIRSAFAFGSFLGMWGCMAFRMKEAPFYQASNVVGMLGLCGIAGALTASNVGKYIPRYGTERISAIGFALHVLAWMVLGLFHNHYAGLIAGVILIDIGMQCIQLANQSATMRLCPEATSRMNTIFMVTYFIGGSFGTFLAGSFWSLWGWYGTVASGLLMIVCAILTTAIARKLVK